MLIGKSLTRSCIVLFFLACGYGTYESVRRVYTPNFNDLVKHKGLRILVTSTIGAFGEMASTRRISNTLSDMGHSCLVVLSRHANALTSFMDFDFVINLRQECKINPNDFNFFVFHYKDQEITQPYNVILSVVPTDVTHQKIIGNETTKNSRIYPFYLSEHTTDFYDYPKKKLFFCGALWDEYRKGRCTKTYKLLDQTGYFEVYGAPKYWKKINLKSYNGFIPNEKDALLHAMQKAGVALVLHSDGHFNNNTTTARIFEALAASNIIICDRLPFIVENFGDTVLYVERDVSPEELFKQIDNHMRWILSHQKEAIDLARKSHKIFMEKFSLEKILQGVIDFYSQYKDEKVEK